MRVPLCDNNLFHLPNDVPDEKAICLPNILCTGFHGCELAQVTEGNTVVIWGAGLSFIYFMQLSMLFIWFNLMTFYHMNSCFLIKIIDSNLKKGPVGLSAALLAKNLKKASRVCVIDCEDYRLSKAHMLGIETIDFSHQDVVDTVLKMFPLGPDCCIDCVGFVE